MNWLEIIELRSTKNNRAGLEVELQYLLYEVVAKTFKKCDARTPECEGQILI